ncbi:MAG: orotidine 5'-phosphate decarboxylase [Candidatus Kariarchaeaceae archaeon]|jgi:orotidine-5'-phosphate decarboxylase
MKLKLPRDNGSNLCIGIDIIDPQKYSISQQLIEETHEYAAAYKLNMQFWHGTTPPQLHKLTEIAHSHQLPIIADLKISDIGSSNRAALQAMADFGFDYVTVSPFPGNLKETSENARDIGIGVISLVLMSNPEAHWILNTGMWKIWAKESNVYSQGIVVGASTSYSQEILSSLNEICPKPFILAPGIGAQGGSSEVLSQVFGRRVLYNVGRGIFQQRDFRKAAREYFTSLV